MQPVIQQLSRYRSYHRHRWNRAAHFVGVPLIVFSLLLVLSWLKFSIIGLPLNAAILLLVVVYAWYLRLDLWLAVATFVLMLPVILLALQAGASGPDVKPVILAGMTFVVGWLFQLAGHLVEGRRPAFLDDLSQALVAPLFLACEVLFTLGLRDDLRRIPD